MKNTPVRQIPDSEIRDLDARTLAERLSQVEDRRVVQMADNVDWLWQQIEADGENAGVPLCWPEFEDSFGWRDGEVTLLAGPNNSGKSALMSQLALHYSRHKPVGLISLEEPFDKQVHRLLRQAYADRHPSKAQFVDLANLLDGQLWHYQAYGTVQTARIYGCLDAFARRGCKLAVIDNLQKCGINDDWDQQREFMNNLIALAQILGLHIVLVHHTRKRGQGISGRSSSDDVRGSSALTDLATNLMIVNRDFDRADALQKQLNGEFLTEADKDLLDEGHDVDFRIQKQKFGTNWNGTIKLWTGAGLTFKTGHYSDDLKLPMSLVKTL